MARLACFMVLIALCLLEPALAEPSGSFSPKNQQSLVTQICQGTKKPRLCVKVVEGDKASLAAMKPTTQAKVSIDLAASMATKMDGFMLANINANLVKGDAKVSMQGCQKNYESLVRDLNFAYLIFVANPQKATESLKAAEEKIAVCDTGLKLAGSKTEFSPIVQTNVLIKDLIRVAKSISAKP